MKSLRIAVAVSSLVGVASCAGSDESGSQESSIATGDDVGAGGASAGSTSAPAANPPSDGPSLDPEENEAEPAPAANGGGPGSDPGAPVPTRPPTNGPVPGSFPFPNDGAGGGGPDEPMGFGGMPTMGEPSAEPAPEPEASNPEPTAPMGEPSPDEPEPEPDAPVDADAGAPVGDPTEVPDIEYCADVVAWDPQWSQWEEEVLLFVNENRAQGADCGEEGTFGPADPLGMDPLLRCTARAHSLDMYERDFFDHLNPDGDGPGERLAAAGYMGFTWGENIAQGYSSPEDVVQGWMDSDGHCSNIMARDFTLIGVGYYPGNTEGFFSPNAHYWTQNFGAEGRMFGGGR